MAMHTNTMPHRVLVVLALFVQLHAGLPGTEGRVSICARACKRREHLLQRIGRLRAR